MQDLRWAEGVWRGRARPEGRAGAPRTSFGRQRQDTCSRAGPRMQPPATKEVGYKDPRERARKGTQGAGSSEERAMGAPTGAPTGEPPKPGWTLTQEGLEAMHPAQCHRHLLFGDLLEDVGAVTSIFPRESVELGYRMPDLWAWTQSLEPPAARQDRLLGVLKAAEARGRVRALRLRYAHMRVRPGRRAARGGAGRCGERDGAGPPAEAGRGGAAERGRGRLGLPAGAAAGQDGGAGGWRPQPRAARPAGGGDLAPHPAPEVRARRHAAGAVSAAAAEAHADPRPPEPSRGAREPGKGRRGPPHRLPTHRVPAPLPRSGGA